MGRFVRQSANPIGQNDRMENMALRQTLADNIEAAIERSLVLDSANALAKKAGISQSHLSKVLRCEAAATTDLIASIAEALDCQPWELLANTEATRKAALERMLGGPVRPVPDKRVEEVFPTVKSMAGKRRKR